MQAAIFLASIGDDYTRLALARPQGKAMPRSKIGISLEESVGCRWVVWLGCCQGMAKGLLGHLEIVAYF